MPDIGPDKVPVPAIGYIRVSMAREFMISPEIQRSVITDYARRSGRVIVDWVEDPDDTGRNFRRKVLGAIARIEAGEAAEILAWRYDRWGRNTREALLNISRVEAAGGAVVSATEPVDVKEAFGRYNRTNLLAQAELQSDIIGEGWRNAHANRLARGIPAAGTPRFGYARLGKVPDPERAHAFRRDKDDPLGERYEPDPVTGPVLAGMYERFTSGQGAVAIAAWLNGAGITTTRGRPWSLTAVLRVLDSGFGAGLMRVHDRDCGCRDRAACRRRAYVPGTHEAVISEPAWKSYLDQRAARATRPARVRDPAYPLTGLVACGSCDGTCNAASANGVQGYGYRCKNHVMHRGCPGVFARRSRVERAVLDWLAVVSGETGESAAAMRARARAAVSAEAAGKRHLAVMARADRELARLLGRSLSDEGLPQEVYETVKAGLLAERAAAEKALAGSSRAVTLNASDFRPFVSELLEQWDLMPPGRRRELLSKLIRKVVLTGAGKRKPARIDIVPVWAPE